MRSGNVLSAEARYVCNELTVKRTTDGLIERINRGPDGHGGPLGAGISCRQLAAPGSERGVTLPLRQSFRVASLHANSRHGCSVLLNR